MALVHASLAWLAAAAVVAVLVTAAWTAAGRTRTYRALDLVLIGQVAVTALTSLAGLATYATVGPLRETLHLLYGVAAVALPIGSRLAAQGRPPAAVGRWVAVATLVALGVTIRSFMTGST